MSTVSLVRPVANEIPARRSRFTHDADSRPADWTGLHDCLVIQVTGELDVNGLPAFRTALNAAVDAGPPVVVVDLRRARFLSVRNAVVLLDFVQRADRDDIGIVMPAAPRQIERVLDVTGVRNLVHRDRVPSGN
ncbi:STAS domain-containing protein [Nocardia niigatensis]|uniref:STAS domain-containing protein n=1 Tax=Nocardia niigatensis TaxID=209249 RepID=UPI000A06E4F3|nr:STAS domain-containing protein [Nocardia niigatensis]